MRKIQPVFAGWVNKRAIQLGRVWLASQLPDSARRPAKQPVEQLMPVSQGEAQQLMAVSPGDCFSAFSASVDPIFRMFLL